MISRASIETIFEVARVEEVIGDFVQLKRSGANYKGLSPFTDEKSPSFMVNPAKQIWKDFSSGKGGNVTGFLMEHEHFTYPEALRYLAKKYNIEIEETEQTDAEKVLANEKESLFLISELAQKYFENTLHSTEEGKAIAMTYFKERGFTLDTLKKFGLGYSPKQKDAFTTYAIQQGYKQEYLEKTGLTVAVDMGLLDRFRGRVMFPIHSMSGRILGFGARILTSDKKIAKYLNSPESDIYHKGKILYGIFQAKQSIAKNDHCYLVEGYTDVIQMNQSGVENVVASSGTALTPDQIRLVSRLTKNITVLYDGDAAGLRASIRGIDLILEQGMNVRVCTFPDGEDPDSFARKHHQDELRAYLQENAKDFIQFKATLLLKESNNDPIKKAEIIRDMVNSIAKIPDTIKQELYIRECSRIMDISEDVLYNTLAQITQKELAEANKTFKAEQKQILKPVSNIPKVDTWFELEYKVIEILLLYGNLSADFTDYVLRENDKGELVEVKETVTKKVYEHIYNHLQQDEIEFTNPEFKELYTLAIEEYLQKNSLDVTEWQFGLSVSLNQIIADLVLREEQYMLNNWESKNIIVKTKEDQISQYLYQTLLALRLQLIQNLIANKAKSLQEVQDTTEELEVIVAYNKLKVKISKILDRVT